MATNAPASVAEKLVNFLNLRAEFSFFDRTEGGSLVFAENEDHIDALTFLLGAELGDRCLCFRANQETGLAAFQKIGRILPVKKSGQVCPGIWEVDFNRGQPPYILYYNGRSGHLLLKPMSNDPAAAQAWAELKKVYTAID